MHNIYLFFFLNCIKIEIVKPKILAYFP